MNHKLAAMILKPALFTTLFLLSLHTTHSQTDDQWTTYVKMKDKGPMTVLVDLNLQYRKASLKNLIVLGTKTNKCLKNGYPNQEGLEELYEFSDAMTKIMEESTKSLLVGIITYQCAGFDVYYTKDTLGLRDKINKEIDAKYGHKKNYVLIDKDRIWKYYKTDVFPNDKWEDFFVNHDMLSQMVSEGDDLSGKRTLKHFFNFKKERQRSRFLRFAKELKFKVDTIAHKKDQTNPYTAQISRMDGIKPLEIETITEGMIHLALLTGGFYNGWETDVKIEE